jgi:hypothetical protein
MGAMKKSPPGSKQPKVSPAAVVRTFKKHMRQLNEMLKDFNNKRDRVRSDIETGAQKTNGRII